VGMALVIGTEGIDLSVGATMALAAALIPLYIGYGPWPAMIVALFAGVAVGLVNGWLVAFAGIQPIIATLGLLVAGRGIALVFANGRLVELFDPTLGALGNEAVLGVPVSVLIVIGVASVAGIVMRRAAFGRRVLAVGGNRAAATLAGLPVRRTRSAACSPPSPACSARPAKVPATRPSWGCSSSSARSRRWSSAAPHCPAAGCASSARSWARC